MKRKFTLGECVLCGSRHDKAGMGRHLRSCYPGRGLKKEARAGRNRRSFLLLVEARHRPQYWMYLGVQGRQTLGALDTVLRDTWLECCGHLSAFSIEGEQYDAMPEDEPGLRSMGFRLDSVLAPGLRFSYEYDFGSTTELALRVILSQEGDGPRNPIRILARNEPPEIACAICGGAATQVCRQCFDEANGKAWLCHRCVKRHGCKDADTVPLVNSPRTGVCGYIGGHGD